MWASGYCYWKQQKSVGVNTGKSCYVRNASLHHCKVASLQRNSWVVGNRVYKFNFKLLMVTVISLRRKKFCRALHRKVMSHICSCSYDFMEVEKCVYYYYYYLKTTSWSSRRNAFNSSIFKSYQHAHSLSRPEVVGGDRTWV